MSAERPIRSICVVGDGIVGLSAAAAFARALPAVRVSIVEAAQDPAALADQLPGSLPAIHRFHAVIGLDELELVRSGAASHLLGTRFDHWSADGAPWIHAFGEHGLKAGDVPFHALWARTREEGQTLPFHRYSAAGVLAEAGKFGHPSDDPNSPLSTFLYALRMDPPRYRARLAALTAALPREPGGYAGVERRAAGGIAALLLEGGTRVEADLYIDCTGPQALLLSALDDRFEDWSRWLPCDLLRLDTEPAEEPTPTDRVTGLASGWEWRSPLADRTILCSVESAQFADQEMPGALAIRPGRRPAPWTANVLALGDAAVAVDPLHFTGLHLAQSGILRALELLPGRDCHPLELAEYNRRTAEEAARVRDFLALHYLRSGRRDTLFWAEMAQRKPPDSLARTLEQFERRCRLPPFEAESFDKDSWLAALLGLGVTPQHPGPLAGGVDLTQASAAMAGYAARLEQLSDRMPTYREVLARFRASAAAAP